MTACAIETAVAGGTAPSAALTIAADGSYAARLAPCAEGEGWTPERWTLDGPEPYAVLLPGDEPEEPSSEVLPLTDGRVLIHRVTGGRHMFALLYPTGPGTGELPVGGIECERLTLLPPAPDGCSAYALASGAGLGSGSDTGTGTTALWLVNGGAFGPEHIADLPGRCTGGVWLDREGRLLAVDQELDGRTKAVAVDLGRGGETSPLLQITEDSDDRLLLADPDSGLLLVRSDAPGYDRLGWGVLGSTRPVRFPESLGCAERQGLAEGAVTPFAVQPEQALTPENCAVALRIDGEGGSWVGVWRASERQMRQLPAPRGWLAGTGLWTPGGELRLPYTTEEVPCGLARAACPELLEGMNARGKTKTGTADADTGTSRPAEAETANTTAPARDTNNTSPVTESAQTDLADSFVPLTPPLSSHAPVSRPVPLQQAPLGATRPPENPLEHDPLPR